MSVEMCNFGWACGTGAAGAGAADGAGACCTGRTLTGAAVGSSSHAGIEALPTGLGAIGLVGAAEVTGLVAVGTGLAVADAEDVEAITWNRVNPEMSDMLCLTDRF